MNEIDLVNEKSVDLIFAGLLFALALLEYVFETRRISRRARSDNAAERITEYAA